MGEFAPTEVEVGQDERDCDQHEEEDDERAVGEANESRNGEARGDEDKGEGVRADHPLAMDGDVVVARGDEGGEGGEEPEAGLDAGLEEDVGLGLIDDVEVMADHE